VSITISKDSRNVDATFRVLYEAYRDLSGQVPGSNVGPIFGLYLKVLATMSAASRNFFDAHQSGSGIFRVDGAAITHQIFDRLPSSEEYRLIMEGPLTVTSVRAEKDKVIVSLKVNDTKLLGRFVKDWEQEIEAASTNYTSAFQDINIFYRIRSGGRPYEMARDPGPTRRGPAALRFLLRTSTRDRPLPVRDAAPWTA
jgi:hypothetical protein